MSSLHVSLTPKLTSFVHDKVKSGLYSNSSEVVRDALRFKIQAEITNEQKLERLKKILHEADEQIKNGKVVDKSVSEIFEDYIKMRNHEEKAI